jgi:pimeloyl-ACP methyl ester carboxylesterase
VSRRRSVYRKLAGHEIHLSEWGDPAAPPLLMFHGLARTGRDFDTCAAHFATRFHVLCPDMLGRGLSAWGPPEAYGFATYGAIAAALVDAVGARKVYWVGTSMGGALGIHLAGGLLHDRIERLVINDIGPELPQAAIERIVTYVGAPPVLSGVVELEAYLRRVYVPFGALSDEEWRRMADTSARRLADGKVTLHYDSDIVRQLSERSDEYVQWDAWQRIAAPTLVLRGATSDLLLPDVADRMAQSNRNARLVEVPGCGHAPALNVTSQIDLLDEFLSK